ncbi:2-polyprenyl-6-methoxyphenol hydroxylase-like FAD-dependent oxidoreductase [Lipingzhangella halophila]|uniref:2-polyprenyl-6-methoxyphenol hydroxylase-like FAD-dependent oxidoreductase n=1 Tax=Lipingzhangella halophila TaxID=1783352 RepID=A0A7W7RG09_9ACTN|nr:FAD-dependent monooxygenase [Lipingzhangella halophila]MBB4930983.1 2-polyprenyl-6-methoxyphenol hydroxylase-like FAD-dependent oxidoreductase [Lipingzhangella halophila]
MTRALIVGGGVGGPIAAAALKRAGLEPVVYEAHSGPGEGLGAFLALAPNGLAALRTVGMLERVRAAASFPTTRIEFVNGSGRRLGLLGGEDHLPAELRGVTINRAALQRAVADSAVDQGIRIEYGKRLAHYTESGSGVVAEFTDGSTAEGAVLVGADGIHSAVRRTLGPEGPSPSYVGLLGIGGYSPAVDAQPTPDATTRMVFGKRGFFGYQTAPSGETYWFGNLGHSRLTREEIAAHGDDVWKEYALELFRGDLPDITRIMRACDPAAFRPLGIYDLASLPHWHRGRAALIGDAAHAVSPASGQGASLAAEDALVLARCLRDIRTVPEALAAYEQERRDRVERIVAEGRRRGAQKAGSANPAALLLRDLTMRVVFELAARFGSHAWIHDYRVDFESRAATSEGNQR